MRMASEDRRRQLPWMALGLTSALTAAVIFALWTSPLRSRAAVSDESRLTLLPGESRSASSPPVHQATVEEEIR